MVNLSCFVPTGTPLKENSGDCGSKHEAVPDQEKSTLKVAI